MFFGKSTCLQGVVSGAFAAVLLLSAIADASADAVDKLRPIGTMSKGQPILGGKEELVLFEHEGQGCLTHFWFGGNFPGVEDTRIRYYIDGEETPSIDMDLYMGHGIGFNDNHAPWITKWMGKIGKRNGVHNNYQIPFGKSIKVTAQRPPEYSDKVRVWWIVRGVENYRPVIGGVTLPKKARMKLHRLEGYIADPMEEFDICKVDGNGAVFQVFIQAKPPKPMTANYLEACIRGYIGGSDEPLMLSSGLEDYFLGTYYFDTGRYYGDMAGLTHFENGSFAGYRIHDVDPLFFQKGLRLTCRNGEGRHGRPGDPPHSKFVPVEFTSYVWAYEW